MRSLYRGPDTASGASAAIEFLSSRRPTASTRSRPVLLQVRAPLRAGDGDDIRALLQQPCQRHLRRRSPCSPRSPAPLRRRDVGVEVVALEPRIVAGKSPSGQSSARARCRRGIPGPRTNGTSPIPSSRSSGRIRGSRLRSHSDTRSGARESGGHVGTRMFSRRLPRGRSSGPCPRATGRPRPRRVLDRHVRVDAMLVEGSMRSVRRRRSDLGDFPDVRGPAVGAGNLAVVDAKSELGGDDGLLKRRPSSARPSKIFIGERAVSSAVSKRLGPSSIARWRVAVDS